MKTLVRAFMILVVSISVYAESTKMGVGVGMTGDTATIRVPLYLEENMRIEPYGSLGYSSGDGATSRLELGAAIHMLQQVSPNVVTYYGVDGRIGYVNYDAIDDSDTSLSVGGVFGFEYYFDKQVSLGGEAGVYAGIGDNFTLNTRSQALLRYYF